jgi:serine/threonine-protein kinase RsbW
MTREVTTRAVVVRLSGDLDAAVVPELRRGLDEALSSSCTNVVLDLSNVLYADSSALGLLVWIDQRLQPCGGRLVVAGAGRDVGRVLELSGLVTVASTLMMSATTDAALEGLELPDRPSEVLWEEQIPVVPTIDALGDVRERVASIVSSLSFPESALFDLKVALGEALVNAVRHGAPLQGEAEVGVHVTAFEDRVVIEVADNGAGFDGTPRDSQDLYAASGRGILFMRALTDKVEYEASPSGGTLVRLTKHRLAVR